MLTRDEKKTALVALVIRLRNSKYTFKAGIMSGLRLFQLARERNRLTWMEMYWQRVIVCIAVRERATNNSLRQKSIF